MFDASQPTRSISREAHGMNYEEAMEATVTREEAEREIRKHGINPTEFFLEVGYRDTYTGAEVLSWLGY
jgi:hypothetical protein